MNYELVKELKDAGFVKEGFIVCDGTQCNMPGEPHFWGEPTLEELIEACGDNLDGLYRDTFWFAYKKLPMEKDNLRKNGKTPSEAVARLWLALNKK